MSKNNDEKKKKFNLYNLFYANRSGKGLTKEEAAQPRTLSRFFKFYWNNLSAIFTVNMMIVFGNFPLIFTMYGLTGNLNVNTSSAASYMFAPLYGAMKFTQSPVSAALFGVYGVPATLSIATTATNVFYYIGLLAIFTFGLVNVGTTYIMRNIVKGEPLFIWHDFWYAIKKNFRQGMIFGIIDVLLLALILHNILFYLGNTGTIFTNILFVLMMVITIIYLMMRFYIYILMVTFDLSIFKMLKNSFIFALLGMKRNMAALIGIVLTCVLNYVIFLFFIPLGIILPFIITFATCAFMGVYAAYPKIKEIMIDPYYESDRPYAKKIEDTVEPIFTDQG